MEFLSRGQNDGSVQKKLNVVAIKFEGLLFAANGPWTVDQAQPSESQ